MLTIIIVYLLMLLNGECLLVLLSHQLLLLFACQLGVLIQRETVQSLVSVCVSQCGGQTETE